MGTCGNPSVMSRFTELLRDDDPSAMEVAEDLLLEHGLTLREMGGGLRARNFTFEMKPLHGPRDQWKMVQTSVDLDTRSPQRVWSKITVANGSARWQQDYVMADGTSIEDARKRAVELAWEVAKAIKPLPMNTTDDELADVAHEALTQARNRIRRHPPEINPARSVLTGPKWDAARAKLASSAAKKNNPGNTEASIAYAMWARDNADDEEEAEVWDKEIGALSVGLSKAQIDNARRASRTIPKDARGSRAIYAKLEDALGKHNPSAPKDALDKYEEFHRYKPTHIGEFSDDFEIPRTMLKAGTAKWVTYRSGKVDPSTLQKPKRPVNYIHEHDAGVHVYLPDDDDNADVIGDDAETITVPNRFRDVEALVKLGDSLGYCFLSPVDDEEEEAEARAPFPELYCTPDGRCLFVIQDKSEVLAMIWGGGLGVFARGIDG